MELLDGYYERESAGGYIRLRCNDCGGEVRFRDCAAGREKAGQMVAVHKPSGCCDERRGIAPELAAPGAAPESSRDPAPRLHRLHR